MAWHPSKALQWLKAIRLPEWPDIHPKGYNGQLTIAEIAPSTFDEVDDVPYIDGA